MSHSMNDIIDLDRYPIAEPDSDLISALVEHCKLESYSNALCMLPGLIRPDAIAHMAAELEALIDNASRFDITRTAYIKPVDPSLPEDHPRKTAHTTKYHQVLNYQISNNSMLRDLFNWQPLTNFLGRAMGYHTFHRSDCPHLALTSKIASEGDTDGWHFDSNEVVFSIVLQAPEQGGEFEYLPNVRSEENQNYETISKAFKDSEPYSQRLKIQPGTLVMFKGMSSLHRVTPVVGKRRRIVALFSYHTEPGHVNGQDYISLVHSMMPNPGIHLNTST
jgi:hypothetical protein